MISRPILRKFCKTQPCADLFSAFAYSDQLKICVFIPREYEAQSLNIDLYYDDTMTHTAEPAKKVLSDEKFDIFEYSFDFGRMCLPSDGGLFYYHFFFDSHGRKMYVSRNREDLLPQVITDENAVSSYQLTVYCDNFRTPDDFKGGIMYQIFVDRFFKGKREVSAREDAVINGNWYSDISEYPEYPGAFVKNNTFYGGTLWGVVEKLPYLKSLGVDFIYLNPIFEACSNHKYDTGDYNKVDEMFGGDEALDELISEAKKQGIGIILDGVFNHTGSDSIYFNKNGRYDTVGAYNSPDSEYADWYFFEKYPDEYKSWWGIEILPKLNGRNEKLREFICSENGVIRKYLKKGVFGWRLDVADELDEDLLCEIRKAAKKEGDRIVIGEVWEDASNKVAYDRRRKYFRGNELDSVMNYPLRQAVIDYIMSGDAFGIARTATEIYMHYPKCVSDTLMNFLGTHDTQRILSVLTGENLNDKTNKELSTYKAEHKNYAAAVQRLKVAYLIVATMPGVPCIYYGDEAGVEGGRDPFNRKPYPWGFENDELVDWYKKLGKIRKSENLFKEGYFRVKESKNSVFAYERFDENEKIIVVVNLGDTDYKTDIDNGTSLLDKCADIHTVPPDSVQIIKVQS